MHCNTCKKQLDNTVDLFLHESNYLTYCKVCLKDTIYYTSSLNDNFHFYKKFTKVKFFSRLNTINENEMYEMLNV